VISYDELLRQFFAQHDPQRPAYSVQYRSAIFYHSPEQRTAAAAALAVAQQRAGTRLFTAVEPAGRFYRAEGYHHKYYLTQDKLLMQELKRLFPRQADFEDSTLVMRLNALAGHYRLPAGISLPLTALSPAAQQRVAQLQEYSGGPAIRCGS
jgi:hypothetical protein